LVAAAQQEDLAAARGQRVDCLVYGGAELAPCVDILGSVRPSRLFTPRALHPLAHDVPVA